MKSRTSLRKHRCAAKVVPAMLVGLLFSGLTARAADLATALGAIERGDYTIGIAALDELAAQGDTTAMTRLATLYQQGKGVALDSTRAAMLYEQAAQRGDADAQYNLGNMYLLGEGVPQDDDWAFTYYREAAKQGHALAQKNVKEFYRAAGLQPPEAEMAPRTPAPTVAAPTVTPAPPPPVLPDAGVTADEFNAIEMARAHGITVTKAPDGAARQPEHRVEPRSAPPPPSPTNADLVTARKLLAGGKSKDALPLLEAQAESGSAEAQYLLSQLLVTIHRNNDDAQNALQWLQRAAAGGNADAQYLLAGRYERGDGVAPDEAEAVTWYRAAARQGHGEARERLRAIYRDAGVPMPNEQSLREGPDQGAALFSPPKPQLALLQQTDVAVKHLCTQHAYSSRAV